MCPFTRRCFTGQRQSTPIQPHNTFWLPLSIFAASVIYWLSLLNGMISMSVPASVHLEFTLIDQTNTGSLGQDVSLRFNVIKAWVFFQKTNYGIGPARNLPFEMRKMQTIMHGLAGQWGMPVEMVTVLSQLETLKPMED